MTIDHWYIGFRDRGTGKREQEYLHYVHLFTIFFTETYQILTRIMSDVATEVHNFSEYANNPSAYTYGNIYNTYSYNKKQDFKRTLDYIVFRKPRMQDNLDIKVLDYR